MRLAVELETTALVAPSVAPDRVSPMPLATGVLRT